MTGRSGRADRPGDAGPSGGVERSGGARRPETARVLVAEDQTVVREGLVLMLGLLPGVEVVGAAADGEEAVRLVARLDPDVVLMDLRMPRCDGVEATRRVRAEHPRTQVVVLTTYDDDDSLFPALRAGARGYLTKDADADAVLRAVDAVLSGEAGLAASVQARLLDRLAYGTAPDGAPREDTAAATGAWSGGPDGLTERETEVLALIAEGLSNQEVARALHIGTATVKTHINNLFAKTGVRDRAQAVRYAYRHGIVT
ncbi:response regulator transcription factor [Streptomyces sp. Z26]|uniref:response regulator transcription factor n=2 Tax=Streptomyces TaxID=1883 RepID=UPI000EF14758|nr:response regulator transcription factor [Streptomyces sp. Z26]RLL69227.1 DNA-binding response regulator [Streptomyces sp. Z26]